MNKFLRENLVLVVAIALPLVVLGLYMLANYVPQKLADPPKYDLLLTSDYNYNAGGKNKLPLRLSIENGKVIAKLYALYTREATDITNSPTLFRFNAAQQNLSSVPIDIDYSKLPSNFFSCKIPDAPETAPSDSSNDYFGCPYNRPTKNADVADIYEIEISALSGLKLSTDLKSPDGFEFAILTSDYSSGLLGDIFYRPRYSSNLALRKDHAIFPILYGVTDYNYYNYRFLAWVVQ